MSVLYSETLSLYRCVQIGSLGREGSRVGSYAIVGYHVDFLLKRIVAVLFQCKDSPFFPVSRRK